MPKAKQIDWFALAALGLFSTVVALEMFHRPATDVAVVIDFHARNAILLALSVICWRSAKAFNK